MTIVYLMRHSEPFKIHRGIEDICDNLLEENKKTPLSINGEKLAERISNNKEFSDLDVVWSSDYVRAMSTAKYFAYRNNLKVNVSYRFGERIHGINSYDELPKGFEERQFEDENYKIGYGESQKEVRDRMYNGLIEVINNYKNKKILIVSHSTAIAFLLSKWCDVSSKNVIYNNNILIEDKWNYCDCLKLIFDYNNEIVNIERVNLGDN